MKIAVLGGFGLMAEAALHDLASNAKVTEVLAADLSLTRAKSVLARIPGRRKVKAVRLDLSDTAAAARALKGAKALLNCAWYELNLKAMDLALAVGAHYVDLGGLYHMTLKQLKRSGEFKRRGLAAALGCGSTPGITNLMVAKMAPSFETIDTVAIYDASHDPSLSEETFLPPFSIRTMLAEYVEPAPVLKGGRMVSVPAHSDPDELVFKDPIGRCKAGTVIHSETATLPRYLRRTGVKNLFFKIVYPESVKRQLAMLVGMGLHQDAPVQVNGGKVSPRRFVTALAQKAAHESPANDPADYEVLRVRITGARGGRPLEKTWDCELRPTRLLSAGALGVGFTGAIAAVMAAQGRTLARGAAAPESLYDPDPFFRELLARKTFRFNETIAHPLPL